MGGHVGGGGAHQAQGQPERELINLIEKYSSVHSNLDTVIHFILHFKTQETERCQVIKMKKTCLPARRFAGGEPGARTVVLFFVTI